MNDKKEKGLDTIVMEAREAGRKEVQAEIESWQQRHPVLHAITQWRKTIAVGGGAGIIGLISLLNPDMIKKIFSSKPVDNATIATIATPADSAIEKDILVQKIVAEIMPLVETRLLQLSADLKDRILDKARSDRRDDFYQHDKSIHTLAISKEQYNREFLPLIERVNKLSNEIAAIYKRMDNGK
jgi:hypothetical protein